MMVSGCMAHPDQLEAAPQSLEVDGNNNNNNNKHVLCYWKLLSVFWKLLVLCYIVWAVFLLVRQPKSPNFNLESATVQLNPDGPALTSEWNITLLGTNPNHDFKIYYKSVRAEVLYQTDGVGEVLYRHGHEVDYSLLRLPRPHSNKEDFEVYSLLRKPWPAFSSNKRNQTRVEFNLSQWRQELGYELVDRIFSHTVGLLGFRFKSSVSFVSRLLPPEHAHLAVTCKLFFRFPPNNNGTGTISQSRKCLIEYEKNYGYEIAVGVSFFVLALLAFVYWRNAYHRHPAGSTIPH